MQPKYSRNSNGSTTGQPNGVTKDQIKKHFLCISDLNGDFESLEKLIAFRKPAAILHTGNFGFLDHNSISQYSHKQLTDVIEASTILTKERREKLLSLPEDLLRNELNISELNNFHRYINGEMKFSVPIYTTHGFLDDVKVLQNLINNKIKNLHFIYPGYSPILETGSVPIRIFGLGGSLIRNRMFDHGTISSILPGSREGSWVTLLQLGTLFEDAQINETPGEIRILLSVASPINDAIISQLACSIKADFTFSVGMNSRYHSSFSINSVYPSLSIYREQMIQSRTRFKEIYEVVKKHYEKLLNKEQLKYVEMALRLLDYLPPDENSGLLSEQGYFTDCQHVVLSNIRFGHGFLVAAQNQITIRLNAEGVNFAHREKNLGLHDETFVDELTDKLINEKSKVHNEVKGNISSTQVEKNTVHVSSGGHNNIEQNVQDVSAPEPASSKLDASLTDERSHNRSRNSNRRSNDLKKEVDFPETSRSTRNSSLTPKRNNSSPNYKSRSDFNKNKSKHNSYEPPLNSNGLENNALSCSEIGGSEGDETSSKLSRNEKIKSIHENESGYIHEHQNPEISVTDDFLPSSQSEYASDLNYNVTQNHDPQINQEAPSNLIEHDNDNNKHNTVSDIDSSALSEARHHDETLTFHPEDPKRTVSENSYQSIDPDFGLSRTQIREAYSNRDYSDVSNEWGIDIVTLNKSSNKPETWKRAFDRLVYVQLRVHFDPLRDINEVFHDLQDEIVRIYVYLDQTYIDVEIKDSERRAIFSDRLNGRKFFDQAIRANPKKVTYDSNRGYQGNGHYNNRYPSPQSRRGFRDNNRRIAFGHQPQNNHSDRYPKRDFYHGN